MPELPEVTSFMLMLQSAEGVLNATVTDLIKTEAEMIEEPKMNEAVLKQNLLGQKIEQINRRGKYLLLSLTGGQTLILHLRLTGSLHMRALNAPFGNFTRFSFVLDNQKRLDFDDIRKFGRVWLTTKPEEVTKKLGLEPFGDEISGAYLFAKFQKKKIPVKSALLEQDIIAGIGNIYADEVLFRCHIHPLTPVNTITVLQWDKFIPILRELFLESIAMKGTSFDQVYTLGRFQNHLNVYSRAGKACRFCLTPIQRFFVNKRTTSFCPKCQPLPAKKPD